MYQTQNKSLFTYMILSYTIERWIIISVLHYIYLMHFVAIFISHCYVHNNGKMIQSTTGFDKQFWRQYRYPWFLIKEISFGYPAVFKIEEKSFCALKRYTTEHLSVIGFKTWKEQQLFSKLYFNKRYVYILTYVS